MLKRMSAGLLAGCSMLLAASPVQAQDFYVGQTILVGFGYCPRGTIEAQGQTLQIATNSALFALYGTTYGGNGTTNFGIPDLRGRVPISAGTGPALPPVARGQSGGNENVTLSVNNLPAHIHAGYSVGTTALGNSSSPANAAPADFVDARKIYALGGNLNANMMPNTATFNSVGGNAPIPVVNPYLTLRWCIVTSGIYPMRPN